MSDSYRLEFEYTESRQCVLTLRIGTFLGGSYHDRLEPEDKINVE